MARVVITIDTETGERKADVNGQIIENIDSCSFYDWSDGPSICIRTKRESKQGLSVNYEVAVASKKDLSQEGYVQLDGEIFGKVVNEIADLTLFMKQMK